MENRRTGRRKFAVGVIWLILVTKYKTGVCIIAIYWSIHRSIMFLTHREPHVHTTASNLSTCLTSEQSYLLVRANVPNGLSVSNSKALSLTQCFRGTDLPPTGSVPLAQESVPKSMARVLQAEEVRKTFREKKKRPRSDDHLGDGVRERQPKRLKTNNELQGPVGIKVRYLFCVPWKSSHNHVLGILA